ncbi:MAG: hypothetical protein AAF610_12805 [Pseudomonadota bacterium]
MPSSASTTLVIEPQRFFVALYGLTGIAVVLTLVSTNAATGLTLVAGLWLALCTWRAAMDPIGSSTVRMVYQTGQPQVHAWINGRWYRQASVEVQASCRWFARLILSVPGQRLPLLVFWPVTSTATLRELRLWSRSVRAHA